MTIVLLRRVALPFLVLLVWAPAAQAWSWPVRGPVLQPFVYDESHPYASGQHRGIDIGAGAAGAQVVAPAAGTVTFAGSVPTHGESVTIETPDGYSVTLTHLGSILVAKGSHVGEGDAVGTIGPSGTPEFDEPYVHLGIRISSDPNGYLDPLRFLPPPSPVAPPDQKNAAASQPSATGASSGLPAAGAPSAGPATEPAAPATAVPATAWAANLRPHHARATSDDPLERAVPSRPARQVRAQQSSERRATPSAKPAPRVQEPVQAMDRHHEPRTRSAQRPLLEVPVRDARTPRVFRREPQPEPAGAATVAAAPQRSSIAVPLGLNGAAALVALAAAVAAGRGTRRRCIGRGPATHAQVLDLPPPPAPLQRERCAA